MRTPSFNMPTNIARNSASLSAEHPKSIQKKGYLRLHYLATHAAPLFYLAQTL
jgi:hypothetical protein